MAASLTVADKLGRAGEYKAEGNSAFKEGEWKKALHAYYNGMLAVKGLDGTGSSGSSGGGGLSSGLAAMLGGGGGGSPSTGSSEEEKEEAKSLIVVLYTNMAACHLKLGRPGRARDFCQKALAIKPGHVKALFRLGSAADAEGAYDVAVSAYDDALEAAAQAGDDSMVRTIEKSKAKSKKRDAQRAAKADAKLKGFLL